eukprot:8443892-Pyramimonas_sp.AAC.1
MASTGLAAGGGGSLWIRVICAMRALCSSLSLVAARALRRCCETSKPPPLPLRLAPDGDGLRLRRVDLLPPPPPQSPLGTSSHS